jgi:hypothetical protein
MARPKGQAKIGGREKGTPNKTTATVREAFENAFRILQDDEEANVINWGKNNTTEFYKLSSKLIPMQITGDPEAPLTIQITGMVIK